MRVEQMNRHEHLYRRTSRPLFILLGLWLAAMLLVMVTPASFWKGGILPLILFDALVPLLFAAVVVVSVVRLVAYIRWTGKYPYYFLFRKRRGPGDTNA